MSTAESVVLAPEGTVTTGSTRSKMASTAKGHEGFPGSRKKIKRGVREMESIENVVESVVNTLDREHGESVKVDMRQKKRPKVSSPVAPLTSAAPAKKTPSPSRLIELSSPATKPEVANKVGDTRVPIDIKVVDGVQIANQRTTEWPKNANGEPVRAAIRYTF